VAKSLYIARSASNKVPPSTAVRGLAASPRKRSVGVYLLMVVATPALS